MNINEHLNLNQVKNEVVRIELAQKSLREETANLEARIIMLEEKRAALKQVLKVFGIK